MLLDGFNHVALLTGSTERFVRFYSEVFGAEVLGTQDAPMGRLTFVRIGPHTEFNLFELDYISAGSRSRYGAHSASAIT